MEEPLATTVQLPIDFNDSLMNPPPISTVKSGSIGKTS